MKQRIEVKSQAEFDACVKNGNIAIVIGCRVVARENSSVVARENSSVVARENSSVVAWENSSVVARENSSVVAWENSSVVAWGNSSVEAWGNSSVEAWGNSSVVARGNSSVVAWGNVFVRLFSCLFIKASAFVAIMRHDDASRTIDGGRVLDTMPEPTIGTEWCDYWGLDAATAPYKVENLDAKILAQIQSDPDRFDMSTFHADKCGPENWCETTHCRAGFAICLAGKAGFELERKFGPEIAGGMIYAVSRPDQKLPDFFCDNETAMKDIETCAAAAAN